MQLIFLHLTSCDGESAGPAAVLVVEFIFWTSINYDSVLHFALYEKSCQQLQMRQYSMY